ncbi:MAG: MFS transporter [Pseudomonadota bacterium]
MLRRYRGLPGRVYVLCLGTFINRAGTMLVPFLALYVQGEMGLDEQVATRAMGAFGLGAMIASVLGGHLTDRLGRRAVMLLGLGGGAAILLVFSSFRTPFSIYAAVFAFALLAEMYRPASSSMIADLTSGEQQTHAFGLMYFAINLGFCLGPLIGGVLAARSFQLLLWGDALTSLLFALIIFVWIRESLPARVADDDGTVTAQVSLTAAARVILHDRIFLLYALAALLCAAVYMQLVSTFPLYLRRLGISPATYGLLLSINAAMVVSLQLPVTSLVARLPRGWVMAVGTFFIGAGFGLMGFAATAWQFALCIVTLTAGELLAFPLSQAIVADLSPPSLRGRYMGVFGLSFSIAIMGGAPLGGMALVHLGGGWTWALCFFVGSLSTGLYVVIRRQLAVRETVNTGDEERAGT